MQNKKVLIISSEVTPYLPQTDQSINSFKIPKTINENPSLCVLIKCYLAGYNRSNKGFTEGNCRNSLVDFV